MVRQARGGRVSRVNSLIQQLVSEEFLRSSDSLVNSLTVSYVDTSSDMKKTTIYVTSLNNKKSKVITSLSRNRAKIQKRVSSQLDMKYTPRLSFKIDPLLENVKKINNLLNSINNE
jgi:ribosome-binding factor A